MPPILALVVLVIAAPVAAAQPAPPPPRKLAADPAPEPRPARKYELLPGLGDRQPGNAALAYNRAFTARPASPANPKAAEARQKNLADWAELPLDKLPLADVRSALEPYRPVLREVESAARRETCDWELTERLRADGIGVILNEVQPSRELAAYLSLRVRLELAENRFDDAAKSLQSGFQMSRHVGEAPSLIQLLVGLALAHIYLDRVEEMIGRPGSPNLYWGLTGLPSPLIDLRVPFEGEGLVFDQTFPGFDRLNRGPVTNDEAYRIIDDTFARLQPLTKVGDPGASAAKLVGGLGLAAFVAFNHPAAKKELVARGRAENDVAAMAPAQAVMLNSLERYRELRDEQWKWVGLPYFEARPGLAKAAERLKAVRKDYPNDLFLAMFSLLLPASEKAFFAAARIERKVAVLRTIEAVRLHAAAHGGKPPAALADVTAVPVPADPVTGKPFPYSATPTGFTLSAPPPPGEPPTPANSLSYEVTLRGK